MFILPRKFVIDFEIQEALKMHRKAICNYFPKATAVLKQEPVLREMSTFVAILARAGTGKGG